MLRIRLANLSLGDRPNLARHLPGEEGIWVFILGDLMVFSLFFGTYLYYRAQSPEVFRVSQAHLNQALGLTNTVLMLSSSWFVATAVRAARRGMRGGTSAALFGCGVACGLCFAIVKYFEYSAKIRAGFTLNTNDFFTFYYMLTGIHLLHVTIGMGVLIFMARYASSGGFTAAKLRNLETGASFWHVVDLLWIVLFPLLYLVG